MATGCLAAAGHELTERDTRLERLPLGGREDQDGAVITEQLIAEFYATVTAMNNEHWRPPTSKKRTPSIGGELKDRAARVQLRVTYSRRAIKSESDLYACTSAIATSGLPVLAPGAVQGSH